MIGRRRGALAAAVGISVAIGCGAAARAPVEATIGPARAEARAAGPNPTRRFVTFPEREAEPKPLAIACGAFVVHRDERAPNRIAVTDATGATVFELSPRSPLETIDVSWCGDLDGDGRPDLAWSSSSGGAHCCRTDVVVTLAPRPIEIVRFEGGNAGGLRAEDLDGDGKLELIGRDDALFELADVPHVATRALPAIFTLVNGRYQRRTPRFRELLTTRRAEMEKELAGCEGDPTCATASAEAILGLSLLLGDVAEVEKRLDLEPDVRAIAFAATPRLATILRGRGEALP